MNVSYVKGDIFTQIGYEFVFALDSTFKCDVGICKQFDDKYGIESTLKAIPVEASKWRGNGYCISFEKGGEKFHALVVKALPQQIPEYINIAKALYTLASEIKESGSVITRKLAFPHICCGSYDKRDWGKIEDIIKDVFKDVDVEILFIEN